MRSFWQQRSPRERLLSLIAAVVILIAIWIYGVNPLLSNQEAQQQQQQFQQNLSLIRWAEHAKPYFNQLKSIPPNLLKTKRNTSWSQTIQSTLQGSALGESLTIIMQNNNKLSLTFRHAPFDALMTQLHGWQLAGLRIIKFNSIATQDSGYCNVTDILTLPKGSTHAS